MPAQSESFDVAVVGGGAIGLACAWRAQQRGARAIVIDAGEPGAWNVAAGMLAPVSEAEFGERELLALGMESARRYADFCAELVHERRIALRRLQPELQQLPLAEVGLGDRGEHARGDVPRAGLARVEHERLRAVAGRAPRASEADRAAADDRDVVAL